MKALTKLSGASNIPRRQQKIEKQLASLFDDAAALPEDCLNSEIRQALQNRALKDVALIERIERLHTKMERYEFLISGEKIVNTLVISVAVLAGIVGAGAGAGSGAISLVLLAAAAAAKVPHAAHAKLDTLQKSASAVETLSLAYQRALKTQKTHNRLLGALNELLQDSKASEESLAEMQDQLNYSQQYLASAVSCFIEKLIEVETTSMPLEGMLSLAAPNDVEGALSPVSNDNGSTPIPKLSSGGMD